MPIPTSSTRLVEGLQGLWVQMSPLEADVVDVEFQVTCERNRVKFDLSQLCKEFELYSVGTMLW